MSGRPPRIWVTRAAPGARDTARAVLAAGGCALVAPLIATRPLPAAPPRPGAFAALAFTSAAGVRAFASIDAGRALPVYAVGRATAAAARAAGYAEVAASDGGAGDLAALLRRSGPPGPVLVPGALEPAFDLPAALRASGVEAQALAVYATARVTPSPRVLALLCARRIDAVLLQSASAARALDAAAGALDVSRPPRVLALSPSCRPQRLGWPCETATLPRTTALLALMRHLDRPTSSG